MFRGEHLITVFTGHNIVEPLDTFSKLFGPIFTVDINCRDVIFKVTFTTFNSLPKAGFTMSSWNFAGVKASGAGWVGTY